MSITMRKLIAICLPTLLLSLLVQAASSSGVHQLSQHAVSPEEVVRQFYDWYLRADLPSPKKKNLATFRKYVTQRLLKQQMDPEVDADLFVDAQDFDEAWKNNISVSKATIRGQQATVEVSLNGKQFSRKLRVTLRQENGAWKINNVKGSE
jgi:hypothetical protein